MSKNKEYKKIQEILYSVLSKWGITVFQKVFPDYFGKEPLKPTDRYMEYPFAVRNLPKPPAKVLDVGCSGSYFILMLAAFGYEAYGIDLREYAITNKIKFDNFYFEKGDIRRTGFADNFFDAITAISTIEHIGIYGRYGMDDDSQGDLKCIKEMKRIVKPGGSLLITVPFGKPKILSPYCKIYGAETISELVEGFILGKEEYFMQDAARDWFEIPKREAMLVDAKIDEYPLCLLKLVKK